MASEIDTRRRTGILPAAGAGMRLRPFRYPKELLPVALTPTEDGVRPVLAVEFALETLVLAGCSRVVIAIGPDKLALPRLLGSGASLGVDLAYVVQESPDGLTDAVLRCLRFAEDDVVLQLPDTLFSPRDASKQVADQLGDHVALSLGVFPTDRPTQLGPVRLADGWVSEIQDKPAETDLETTWGVAGWTSTFSAFLRRWAEAQTGERLPPIGHAFQAFQSGYRVRGTDFSDGHFHDIGTTRSLAELLVDDG